MRIAVLLVGAGPDSPPHVTAMLDMQYADRGTPPKGVYRIDSAFSENDIANPLLVAQALAKAWGRIAQMVEKGSV